MASSCAYTTTTNEHGRDQAVQQVLDDTPLLSDELMQLAKWIAQYYVAPLGKCYANDAAGREVRRHFVYRIAERANVCCARHDAVRCRGKWRGATFEVVSRGAEPRDCGAELSG